MADILVFLCEFLVFAEAFSTGSYPVATDRSLKCVWFLKIHSEEENRPLSMPYSVDQPQQEPQQDPYCHRW